MLQYLVFNITVIMLLCTMSCTGSKSIEQGATPSPISEDLALPTPASTLPELIANMSSDDMGVRLVSIYALENYGDDAAPAIPALLTNLYVDDFDVRKAAVHALGQLGPTAQESVPDLIKVLQNDTYYHARVAAAEALGEIGDPVAVPALADALFKENSQPYDIAITCAVSIAKITRERFRDLDSLVYTLNESGVPLIVIDARNWWEEKGQFQDWTRK